MFEYDEEAVFQDADLLQAEYEAESAAFVERAKKACQHSSTVGLPADGNIYYPEQVGLKPGQRRCTGDGFGIPACGRVFESDEEHQDAVYGAMGL